MTFGNSSRSSAIRLVLRRYQMGRDTPCTRHGVGTSVCCGARCGRRPMGETKEETWEDGMSVEDAWSAGGGGEGGAESTLLPIDKAGSSGRKAPAARAHAALLHIPSASASEFPAPPRATLPQR